VKYKSAAVMMVFLLSGCSNKTIWVKPGSTAADFYRAKSYCEALSTGATPMDYSSPASSTTYHSGSVSGSGGNYGTFSGTSATYNDNSAQVFANLGQSIRRQQIFDDCMKGQGFVLQGERSRLASSVGNASNSETTTKRSTDKDAEWKESSVDAFYAEVVVDDTKLLSMPDFDAKELDTMQKGEKVEVIAEANYFWFKVRYKWQDGYVLQPWITSDSSPDIDQKIPN